MSRCHVDNIWFYWRKRPNVRFKIDSLLPHHGSKMSRSNVKNIWNCCNKTRRENVPTPRYKYLVLYMQTWLESVQRFYWKYLVLLPQTWLHNVSTSHRKYPVLLKKTSRKMSQCSYCHKPVWKILWRHIKNIWFYTCKHDWKMSRGFTENTWFCCHITTRKCPDVTLKISGFVATKPGWKTSWCHVKNIWFYTCRHGRKVLRGFIERTWFYCHKPAG